MKQQQKVSKTEKEIQNDIIVNQQIKQYSDFCKRVEMETKDSDMRIKWLTNKVELKELEEKVEGIKNIEVALIKNVLDTVIKKLDIADKMQELYMMYGIELPVVGNSSQRIVDTNIDGGQSNG